MLFVLIVVAPVTAKLVSELIAPLKLTPVLPLNVKLFAPVIALKLKAPAELVSVEPVPIVKALL